MLDGIIAILSAPLRYRLRKTKDGAIAVAIFEKSHQ